MVSAKSWHKKLARLSVGACLHSRTWMKWRVDEAALMRLSVMMRQFGPRGICFAGRLCVGSEMPLQLLEEIHARVMLRIQKLQPAIFRM